MLFACTRIWCTGCIVFPLRCVVVGAIVGVVDAVVVVVIVVVVVVIDIVTVVVSFDAVVTATVVGDGIYACTQCNTPTIQVIEYTT